MAKEVLYEVAERIATITLNRPDKLNAWTVAMEEQVRSAVDEAQRDPEVRVMIVTGAGRGFCAGADMSLLGTVASQGLGDSGREFLSGGTSRADVRPDFQKKFSWLLALNKPVIAAVNGPAIGLGVVIALYCDLRFASQAARFSAIFARRGLIAEYGIAWMLPRIVGLPNALDLLLSARQIDAQEAMRMGLVNQVFDKDSFMAGVRAYARDLASGASPRSLSVIKRQVYDAMFQSLSEAFDASVDQMVLSLRSEDFKEGVAHYLEKRAPAFTGR